MDRSPTIAVTGATGAVGGRVAGMLADAGVPQRLIVRSPERAPDLPGAELGEAEYGDATAARRALEGIATLSMVSASESADRLDQHRTFIRAAADAGVRHVVYLSFLNAAPDATFTLARDHHATEEAIAQTGMAATFLRDSFYMDILPEFVGEDGVLRGPAGDGRCSFVAREDVARSAAAILQDPAAHRGRSYDVTGPEALDLAEVADALTRAQGRPVTYHAETVEEAYESRNALDPAPWQADAWVSTYTAIAAGELTRVSPDVERLTGSPPMSFEAFLADRRGD